MVGPLPLDQKANQNKYILDCNMLSTICDKFTNFKIVATHKKTLGRRSGDNPKQWQ